jgi:hypothetical protein
MRSRWLAERTVGPLLPILAIVTEGALLAVAYVAIETAIDHRAPLLGTLELSVAAGIAAVGAARGWLRPDDDPGRFLLLVFGLGAVGWLWDDRVRELLMAGDPLAALPLHPGGWLMLVAALRGVGRGVEVDDRAQTRLVLGGVPLLAVPWTIGQLGAQALTPIFTERAFLASITFVTAGFMAAGLARLREIGRETGIDWRHDPSWLGTVLGVLVAVLALGIPASMLLGLPGDAVARGILDPVLTLVSYVFFGGLAIAALVAAVLAGALRRLGIELPMPMTPEELARLPWAETYTIDQLRGGLTGLVAIWIALAVVLLVLGRVWLRRRAGRPARGTREERRIEVPQRRRRARPASAAVAVRRPTRAADAVTAYLAALEELESHDPPSARGPAETPRAHARRLGAPDELVRLQADYAIARYAGRTISPTENRRAIGRWRRMRDRLRGSGLRGDATP